MKFDLKRSVTLTGKISNESVLRAMDKMMELWNESKMKNDEVFLIINSHGGSCDAGFMFIDLVKAYGGAKLVTIGTGYLGSMAIPIFCLGTYRILTRHTALFFHEPASTSEKEVCTSVSEMESEVKDLRCSQSWCVDFIVEQCEKKVSKEKILDLMKKNSWVYPEEALKLGLADEIVG